MNKEETPKLIHEIFHLGVVAKIWEDEEDRSLPQITFHRRTHVNSEGEEFTHERSFLVFDELESLSKVIEEARSWLREEYLPGLRED